MRLLRDPLPWLEAMADLDTHTLKAHTEAAGQPWDPLQQRARLQDSLPDSQFVGIAREESLLAYVLLRPMAEAAGRDWFVGMINSDPRHRDAGLWRLLFGAIAELLRAESVQQLHSHVYKSNAASLALHRRLGFQVVRENARALAFCVSTSTLLAHPLLRRQGRPD